MNGLHVRLAAVALLSLLGGCSNNPTSPVARILAPKCVAPAPLLGQPSTAPSYIVSFHYWVNPVTETQRLASTYSFTPRYVYQYAIKGFSAELTPGVVADLRCEFSRPQRRDTGR